MILDGFLQVFIGGLIGGFLGDFLGWWKLRTCAPHKLPYYLKSPFYWCLTVVMWLLGGILAVAYGTQQINAVLAVNLGISAPLILENLASTVPKLSDISSS